MNANGPTETAIWVAVYAGECVWSRKATDTTNMKGAYQAADNAVTGFRACEDAAKKAAAEVLVATEAERRAEKAARR